MAQWLAGHDEHLRNEKGKCQIASEVHVNFKEQVKVLAYIIS